MNRIAAWGLLAILLAGCARSLPKPAEVEATGHVTLDGKPLRSGTITFTSLERSGGGTTVIEQGVYRIDSHAGVFAGRNRVEVRDPDGQVLAHSNGVSQLIQDIVPGENQLDFKLKSSL